jgi:hypothetical protein
MIKCTHSQEISGATVSVRKKSPACNTFKNQSGIVCTFFLMLLSISLCSGAEFDEDVERRLRIGLGLFRGLLASDLELTSKANTDNKLLLLVVYHGDPVDIQPFVEQLANSGRGEKQGKLRNLALKIVVTDDIHFQAYQTVIPAGIYIAQDLPDQELSAVIEYGISKQIIVYSPFEGHVQKGILAGLAIGIRVQPSINLMTLQKSGLHIKALFLKIAKIYE